MRTIGIVSANYVSGNFGELTDNRTLASLPFAGRYRLIDFVLSNMVNSGIDTVGVLTPYNSASLIDHIGVGKPWSLDKKVGGMFLLPGSVYGLHMPGNRFIFRDFLNNKEFVEKDNADYILVAASSDVINIDYTDLIEAHKNSGAPLTILYKTVEEGEGLRGFFVKTNEDGIVTEMTTRSKGKSKYFIDRFVMDKSFFMQFIDWFRALEYMDIMDIVSLNLDKFDVNTVEFNGYVGKISNLVDYHRVNQEMLDSNVRNEIFNNMDRPIYTKVQDEPPAQFTKTSNVKNSLVAAGCIIEGTVENSIIFRSTRIRPGAVIKDSIILPHGDVMENAYVENVVADKNVVFTSDCAIVSGDIAPITIGKNKNV